MNDRGMKKFAPFKALKGQEEAIKKMIKKQGKLARPELAEDQLELNRQVLERVEADSIVRIEYFSAGEIEIVTGSVIKVGAGFIELKAENAEKKIEFRDLLTIEILAG